MPYQSSIVKAVIASRDLIQALLYPSPATPLPSISDAQTMALKQLAIIFADVYQPYQPLSQLLENGALLPRVQNLAPIPTN